VSVKTTPREQYVINDVSESLNDEALFSEFYLNSIIGTDDDNLLEY
jgi:hypothetical protein